MFKFFRSFRQRLLREGKTKSYLKYAVGEITLVVIGILIALQINLWKEQYNQRQQEIQILKQLQDEFQANLMQLDQKISMRKAMINAGLQLINYCDDHSLIIPDSIDTYLARTTVSPTFDPVTNDLIGSGNLYLLSNTELRGRLSRWTSDLVQVTEEEKA
jgi:type II secretory pathway pseudopilin PulG